MSDDTQATTELQAMDLVTTEARLPRAGITTLAIELG